MDEDIIKRGTSPNVYARVENGASFATQQQVLSLVNRFLNKAKPARCRRKDAATRPVFNELRFTEHERSTFVYLLTEVLEGRLVIDTTTGQPRR